MKKYIKSFILLVALLLFIPLNTNAYSNNNSEYVIESYDINIVVNEDNTLNITEQIGVYFNVNKHGIFRKIPLHNNVIRLDGTTSKNRAQISNIEVSDEYSLSTEKGYKIIKIGNPYKTLNGQKNYKISYVYNLGRDTGKNYDELYFNLIGDEWDTSISNITFTIIMPKEFDVSKLGFSSGKKGFTDSSKITYSVDGNVITGKYEGTLNAENALTVRLELPDGYFVGASYNIDLMSIIAIILSLIFAFISYMLWHKFGKDNQVVETVEFYPPQGFNSAEIGLLYNGRVDKKDVISLLIYLANKGYIKIVEIQEKSLFSNSKFKIIKQKEYDGNNPNEEAFLNGLFASKDSLKSYEDGKKYLKNKELIQKMDSNKDVTEVTEEDLFDNFYKTIDSIVSNLNNKKNKEKIFEKTSLGKGALIISMIIVTFILITIKPIMELGNGFILLPTALIFSGSGFLMILTALFIKRNMAIKLFHLILGLIFLAIEWPIVLPALFIEPIYLITYIIGLVCITLMFIFTTIMPKRNKFGNDMLGKIKGFKNFLEIVEKPKLEAIVLENPTYFYDILPYTYVLNISDKWIKKFESISLQAPSWYVGTLDFSSISFGNFMDSAMTSASSSMPSGIGGSSGGGSSGGGSGGGGGGSW